VAVQLPRSVKKCHGVCRVPISVPFPNPRHSLGRVAAWSWQSATPWTSTSGTAAASDLHLWAVGQLDRTYLAAEVPVCPSPGSAEAPHRHHQRQAKQPGRPRQRTGRRDTVSQVPPSHRINTTSGRRLTPSPPPSTEPWLASALAAPSTLRLFVSWGPADGMPAV
jgi:hypothetical protein